MNKKLKTFFKNCSLKQNIFFEKKFFLEKILILEKNFLPLVPKSLGA